MPGNRKEFQWAQAIISTCEETVLKLVVRVINFYEATKVCLLSHFKGYMNKISIKLLFKKLSYETLCLGEWSWQLKK